MKKSCLLVVVGFAMSWSFPSALSAQELQEGTWSGSQTNPNNGNTRAVSLEVKKIADPHWRWRAGTEEVLSVTLVTQQGQVPLSEIQLEGETLSYSYTIPQAGLQVNCNLTLQQDSSYAGDCAAQGGGGRRLVTLTPPTGSS